MLHSQVEVPGMSNGNKVEALGYEIIVLYFITIVIRGTLEKYRCLLSLFYLANIRFIVAIIVFFW